MKQLFRFFRGELNGFFLNAVCVFMNTYLLTTELIDELIYNRRFQWVLQENTSAGQVAIREQDIFNVGKIGGLFTPRTYAKTSLGSIWFTNTEQGMADIGAVYQDKIRTERALLNMEYESFFFHKVEPDEIADTDDINKLATEADRATYREAGAELLGYVKEGTELFTDEGDIIEESIIAPEDGPPTDGAYVEWYGSKYLTYEEFFDRETPLTIDVYKVLFECLQKIRRRGPNIASLIEITEILGGATTIRHFASIQARDTWYTNNASYLVRGAYCGVGNPPVYLVYTGRAWVDAVYPPPSFMGNIEIMQEEVKDADGYVVNQVYRVEYDLDDGAIVYNRERRYAAWLYLCEAKFKMFYFVDRATMS